MKLCNAAIVASLVVATVSLSTAQTKIACVGNSITAGAGLAGGQAYPDQLQLLLGSNYTVRNEGVSGTTLLKAGDSPYWNTAQFSDIFSYKPNIITIKLGTNDSKSWNWGPYHTNYPIDYNAMIDTFLTISPKPQIWIILPAPAYSNGYGIDGDTIEKDMIPILKTIAAQRNLPYIDCHTPLLNHPELFQDGVHPTAAGADTIANIIYRALQGKPMVDLSDTLVTSVYAIGQTWTVSTKKITAVNLLPGVAHLTGALTLSKKSAWLTLSVDATKLDSQVITNTIDPSSLPATEKKYYDTVTVHAGNGLAADLTYRVLLWIQQTPTLTAVSLTPGDSGALPSGRSFRFAATAVDQYSIAMQSQPAFTWTATGGTVSTTGLFAPSGSATAGRVRAVVQGNNAIADSTKFSLIACSPGLAYDYFPHVWLSTVTGIASLTPSRSGTADSVSVAPAPDADSFALRFTGYVLVPVDGLYSFYTTSDDGSALYIDGQKVVDNDGAHGPQERVGTVTLGWGLHALTVLFFQEAGGQEVSASWSGPTITKQLIADSMMFHAALPTGISLKSSFSSNVSATTMNAVNDGLSISVANGKPWTLELYSLNGVAIARTVGKSSCVILLDRQLSPGMFVIARLRSESGEFVSRILLK